MIEDVKSFIDNCAACFFTKKSKNINLKTKVIITKGNLERLVADGWQLDEDLKSIMGYNWVIDMVEFF